MPVAEALWVNLCCLNVLLAANKKKMGHKNNTKRLKKCSQCMFEVKKKIFISQNVTDVWPLAQLQRRGVREFKRRCQAGERTGGGDGTEKLSTAFSEAGVERMGGFSFRTPEES